MKACVSSILAFSCFTTSCRKKNEDDWLSASSFPTREDLKRVPRGLFCFFTSKPLLALVISRPKKLTVSPSWRNTTTHVKYRLVFLCSQIAHDVFLWSRAHHVTQEDRIFLIVVHVSSQTSKNRTSTGCGSCR